MKRALLATSVALAMAVIFGVLATSESSSFSSDQRHHEPQVIAARYHLRTRTSDFYSRAKAGGNPQATKR